jgi:hypothetical protein
MKAAYVTLLTKNTYLPGTLILHKSLVDTGAKYPLVVMVTDGLPPDGLGVLKRRGIDFVVIERLHPEEGTHTLASHDVRFADTWTKLR